MANEPRAGARHPDSEAAQRRRWRTYAAVAIGILALIFVLQNSQDVEVDFIFATTTTPLFFVLLIAIALGALIGWLLPRVRRRRAEK